MSRLVEIQRNVLEHNDNLAQQLRQQFQEARCFVTNWVSSPGSGKTALLTETMRQLIERDFKVAALVGDLATDNDAERLKDSGAAVKQIRTAGMCHLEANMIAQHLSEWDLQKIDFLFIENVGNLVCPASYDLGEARNIVLISVTEGEDKPLKYPPIFQSADDAVITKIDLAEAVDLDREAIHLNISQVGPHLQRFETSAKWGQGVAAWVTHLGVKRNAWLFQLDSKESEALITNQA